MSTAPPSASSGGKAERVGWGGWVGRNGQTTDATKPHHTTPLTFARLEDGHQRLVDAGRGHHDGEEVDLCEGRGEG